MPTPEEIRKIQKRLELEQYQTVIVADIRNFLECIPTENINGEDTFSPAGLDSFERYIKWQKSGIQFQPVIFPPKSAQEFISIAKTMNNKSTRISECSNFAYHAAGILLDDPQIRLNYNIAIVGTMGGLHNITLMLPKNHEIPETITGNYRLPENSFIVDPWALGMGHKAENALMVSPKQFAYSGSLYDKMTVHYQSNKDKKLNDLLNDLQPNPTLKPYSNASASVKIPSQAVHPQTTRSTAQTNTTPPARPVAQTQTNTTPPARPVVQTQTNTTPPARPVAQTQTNTTPPARPVAQTQTNTTPPARPVVQTQTNTTPPARPVAQTQTNTTPPARPVAQTQTNTTPPARPVVQTQTNTTPPARPVAQTQTNTTPPARPVAQTQTNTTPPARPVAQTQTNTTPPARPVAQTQTNTTPPARPVAQTQTNTTPPARPVAQTQTNTTPPARPAAQTQTQPSSPKTQYPSSYGTMWQKVQTMVDGRVSNEKMHIKQMREILTDYTKNDSMIKRALTLHWNRHHIKEVSDIVAKIDSDNLINPKQILSELEKIQATNSTGSFKKRLNFMREQLTPETPDESQSPSCSKP